MGIDEHNNPAKTPGFLMIATQNPPSLVGRSEEDPALRRRFIKMKLDWPVYKDLILNSEKSIQSVAHCRNGFFYSENSPSECATNNLTCTI